MDSLSALLCTCLFHWSNESNAIAWQLGSGTCAQDLAVGGAGVKRKGNKNEQKQLEKISGLHAAGWPVCAEAPRLFQRIGYKFGSFLLVLWSL